MSKDNKPIYNFGLHLLDLNKYIYNLGTNVLGYLNSKKDWNLGQKEEFINSYNLYIAGLKDLLANNTDRFRTDDFGTIYDSQNILSSKDNDVDGLEYYYNNKGERIKTSDYDKLKDKKKKNYNTFSSNREVASYFNLIGRKLAEVTKKPVEGASSNKFDLSKNGFLNQWLLDNNPAGGTLNLTPYLELEKIDETTGKRGTSERSKYLADLLLSYVDNLPEYDFSDTVFKTRDEYLSRLKGAIEGLKLDGYNSQDTIALTRAGLSSDFLRDYFSDGTKLETEEEKLEDPNKSKIEEYKSQGYTDEEILKLLANEELLAAYQRLQTVKQSDAEVLETKKLEWLDSIRNRQFNSRVNFYLPSPAYNTKWYEDNIKAYNYDPNRWLKMELLYNYFLNPDLPRLRGGKPLNTKQQLANHLDWATRISGILLGYLTSSGSYIIPSTIDYNTMSAIQYNPNTRLVLEISLIGTGNAFIESLINDYYNKNIASNKLGGTIEVMQYGGDFSQFNNYVNNLKNTEEEKSSQLKKEAEETGKTPELIKAGLRKPSEGFTAVDKARIGAAAADIGAIISAYAPGYGSIASAGLGVVSTLTNLGADIADDSVSAWDAAKNAAFGLGMDVVGVIPGFGAAGKSSKIFKNIVKYVPRIITILSAMNLANPEIINSVKKIGTDESLTVDDYKNISLALSTVAGLSNMGVSSMRSRAYKNAAKTGDRTIEVKSGEMKRITPENLEKLEKAESLEKANSILKNINGFENDELAYTFKRGKNPFNRLFWHKPKTGDHYDFNFKRKKKGKNVKFGSTASERIFMKAVNSKSPIQINIPWSKIKRPNWLKFKNPYSIEKVVETPKIPLREINADDIVSKQIIQPKMKLKEFIDSKLPKKPTKGAIRQKVKKQYDDIFEPIIEREYNQVWEEALKNNPGYGYLEIFPKRNPYIIPQTTEIYINPLTTKSSTPTRYLWELNPKSKPNKQHIKRELPSKLSKKKKKKKTSKDDRVTRKYNGGTLNVSKVRKFLKAGSITLNNGIVDWSKTNQETPLLLWSGSALYSNHPLSLYIVPNYTLSGESGVSNISKGLNYTFSTLDRLLSVLNRIKNKSMTIDDVNIMLKRHWGMYLSWNPNSAPVENEDVRNYLKTYQGFGLNDEIIAPNYKQNYIINSQNPNSNDAPGKWNMDGLYSLITDDRRVLARKSDYDNNLELLKKDIELAKSLGYEYYLDPDTLYYMLKPLSVDLGTLDKSGPFLTKVADEQQVNTNSVGFKDSLLSKLSPTLKYGLPRALYADSINRKMTDLAIDNEKAYLKDPFSFNRYVRSNLDAEVQGLKNYTAIRNRVSLPISSDGRLLTLANLTSEVEGQKAIDAGKLLSNQTAEKYAELALLQLKENARDAHDTALFNRWSNLLTLSNKNKYELAYLNKKHSIWDTFWLLLEFDAKTKEAETKALRDNFALSDIELAINNDLGTYAPNLSPEALDIWNQVLTGKILPHQLSNEQLLNYRLAMKEAAIVKLNLLRQYYNIPSTLWSRVRRINTPISMAKKGAKVETADKNLERFYKSIFKLLDLSEKLLERLSKSIYALYKK